MGFSKYLDPRRYLAYLARRQALVRYDLASVRAEEKLKFEALGLDAELGLQRLNDVLVPLQGKPFDYLKGTDSVHWLLFSCLSLTEWGANVRNILEIGTFRGKTAVILKTLFSEATVVTCDLPEHDPILGSSYRRDNPEGLREYKQVRDGRVTQPGIRFVESNSFFLPAVAPGPYDLIWMDGGHLYPEVAWDMCNAWHMCRPGGMILCDDIYTDPKGRDAYGSYAGYEVIDYLAQRLDVSPTHFLKRESPEWSALPRQRKFVSLLKKPLA